MRIQLDPGPRSKTSESNWIRIRGHKNANPKPKTMLIQLVPGAQKNANPTGSRSEGPKHTYPTASGSTGLSDETNGYQSLRFSCLLVVLSGTNWPENSKFTRSTGINPFYTYCTTLYAQRSTNMFKFIIWTSKLTAYY